MKSVREEAARWFARLRDAEPDRPDRGRFEAWLASNPAHAAEYHAIADVWGDFDSNARLGELAGAVERRIAAEARLGQDRRRLIKRGVLGIFLSSTAGVAAWRGWAYWHGLPLVQLVAQTQAGETGRQLLPDGSHVTLGPDARIEVGYYRNRRLVALISGDAIFDVVKDAGRPFIVDGGLARATVLGTRFAVNCGSQRVRVSVESGRVQVEGAGGGLPIVLDPGEVAEVKAGGVAHRLPAPAKDGFAWQRGTLVFDNAGLQEIASTLSRYGRLRVRAAGDNGQRITAVVQTADIEHFLQSLPSIAQVRIEEHPGETRIIPR